MSKNVGIDTDFLNHLLEIKRCDDVYDLIIRFFNALDFKPEMHQLVYENEFINKKDEVVVSLFDNKNFIVRQLSDIWVNQTGGQQYYEMIIKNIYKSFMGKEYPCEKICSEWKLKQSLGEVHTVVMCAFLDYNCMLSDDKKAYQLKGIVNKLLIKPIQILNRKECIDKVRSLEDDERILKSKELKVLSHT